MKRILVIFLVCFTVSAVFSQDSVLPPDLSGAEKIKWLNDKAEELKRNDPAKSMRFARQVLQLSGENEPAAITAHNTLGNIYDYLSDHSRAVYHYQKMDSIAEKLGDLKSRSAALNSLGILLFKDKKYETAGEYYNRALEMKKKTGDKAGIGAIYNNLGNLQYAQKSFSQALDFYKKSLVIKNETGDTKNMSITVTNMANVFIDLEQADSADHYFRKAITFARKENDFVYAASIVYNYSAFLFESGKTGQAKDSCLAALELADKTGKLETQADCYYLLTDIYRSLNDYEKALEAMDNYSILTDSLTRLENRNSVNELQVKYETEKMEATIQLYEKNQEVTAAWIISLVLGFILVGFSSFMFYYRSKARKLVNVRLEEHNRKITEQKKEITDSINYAKRIQESILPPAAYVKQLLPESFVFYKPKDIVSGDFYWVEKVPGTSSVLFAAVDCTGHGVPGALMSVVGLNLISQAVNEKKLYQPSAIIGHLDQGVNDTLRQSDAENTVKDGMDLALCCLDYETGRLQYSGAYNNLWVVRYNGGDPFLEEFKADKSPIGVNVDGITDVYTNYEMMLQPGDAVYIYSDGYADQFGGPLGKKFKYRPLKELITRIHASKMADQHLALERTMTEWMGSHDQVDDMLLIGVKWKEKI